MNDLCLTCGHEHRHHSGLANMIDCEIPGCSCIEFSAHVTGPAGVTTPPEPPAGPKPITNVDDLRITGLTEEEAESFMAAITEQRAPVGPPDLHQAIQAATTALCDQHPAIGLSDPWARVARIAVEAAWPHAEGVIANARDKVDRKREANAAMQRQADDDLHQAIQAIQAATGALRELSTWPREQCEFAARTATVAAAPILLQATRDRHADLEVYAAELRDLLELLHELMSSERLSTGERLHDANTVKARVRAALQVDGPARGHAILAEVERLRKVEQAAREFLDAAEAVPQAVSWDEFQAAANRLGDALDQAAQREDDR